MAACSLSICIQKKDVNLCSKEGCQFVFKRRMSVCVQKKDVNLCSKEGAFYLWQVKEKLTFLSFVFQICAVQGVACVKRLHVHCVQKNEVFCSWQVEPPKSVLTSMPVPSTDSIHFHPLTPSSNLPARAGRENSKFPVSDLPYKFQLDDISTNFARVSLHRSSCVLFSCIYN